MTFKQFCAVLVLVAIFVMFMGCLIGFCSFFFDNGAGTYHYTNSDTYYQTDCGHDIQRYHDSNGNYCL